MAHINLGNVLKEQFKLDEAVVQYRQALAVQPDCADAHGNLGIVLFNQGKFGEASAQSRQALALKPDFVEAHINLGNALIEQGRLEEAVVHYRRVLALKPDDVGTENQLMHQLQHLCEWSGFNDVFDRQKKLIQGKDHAGISPFTLLSTPSSPAEQLACARNRAVSLVSSSTLLRTQLGFNFARVSKTRLRIGYLSTDFCQHAVACLIAELFELHDRQTFEVYAYSCGPDDRSAMRKRLERACDRFVDVRDISFQEAARRIYEDRIDVLVDLNGYTKGARTEIVALRPAPIQVNWLGYPGTMGAEFVDYIITDRFITPPGHASYFSEQIVYLPDCYQVNDRKRKIASRTPTKREMGLPEDGFVFCCFNNTFKITSAVFDVWMRLLKKIPKSVLWLLEANSGALANLRREAKVRGVNPDRLVFAPKVSTDKHLARFRLADLFLDTMPYNAHTTASEALWVGLPILTCPGETFASRVAGSLLTAIRLPELTTRSLSEYEAAALRLARDPSELAGLRRRLAKNRLMTPLFDSERFTRHLERAYKMMWDIYANGDAPRRIEVLPRGAARRTPAGT
jgi:predicted O-linked N-acetylglucosamine transferase (SPINDLY family)